MQKLPAMTPCTSPRKKIRPRRIETLGANENLHASWLTQSPPTTTSLSERERNEAMAKMLGLAGMKPFKPKPLLDGAIYLADNSRPVSPLW